MRKLTFKHALTPEGIVSGCRFEIDDQGLIIGVGRSEGPFDGDLAIPGMPNAHSHAFQRALAGRGEARGGEDSFWSWREAMYALAATIDPDALYRVALTAFREMLTAGFTSVAEFHYLHHLPDGTPGTQMADAVVAAATEAGIRLRLLPVYYQRGGFDKPATDGQRRFLHASVEDYLRFVDDIQHPHKGIAPHSLRAVPLNHLLELATSNFGAQCASGPTDRDTLIHIHISEQRAEVEQCLAAHGKTPIELLADTVQLDERWVLVHATHADAIERQRIVESGACVALCPLTEAYLGDGLFAATEFAAAGGRFAIGSDSNARIDAIEELRWLEYGQRLRDEKRARLADANGIGQTLWSRAALGGAQATGFPVGALAVGHFADIVVLAASGTPWQGVAVEHWLDAWLTGGSRSDIDAVYVGGVKR